MNVNIGLIGGVYASLGKVFIDIIRIGVRNHNVCKFNADIC